MFAEILKRSAEEIGTRVGSETPSEVFSSRIFLSNLISADSMLDGSEEVLESSFVPVDDFLRVALSKWIDSAKRPVVHPQMNNVDFAGWTVFLKFRRAKRTPRRPRRSNAVVGRKGLKSDSIFPTSAVCATSQQNRRVH